MLSLPCPRWVSPASPCVDMMRLDFSVGAGERWGTAGLSEGLVSLVEGISGGGVCVFPLAHCTLGKPPLSGEGKDSGWILYLLLRWG